MDRKKRHGALPFSTTLLYVRESSGLDFGGFSLPDNFDITKIMGIMSALSDNKIDERSKLLLALKPHLSEKRQQRVDKAVKLLKLASLIPIVKEQGLFDLI